MFLGFSVSMGIYRCHGCLSVSMGVYGFLCVYEYLWVA